MNVGVTLYGYLCDCVAVCLDMFDNVCVNVCVCVDGCMDICVCDYMYGCPYGTLYGCMWTCERLSDTHIYIDRQTDKATYKLKINF